jgi:hypothetical protein
LEQFTLQDRPGQTLPVLLRVQPVPQLGLLELLALLERQALELELAQE